MDIIKKHSTKKKIVTISTVVFGIVTLVALFLKLGSSSVTNINSISDASSALESLGSSMTLIVGFVYLCLIASIILVVLSGYYFFKKNNKEYVIFIEFIGSILSTLFLFLSLSGVNAIAKAVKATNSNDWDSLFSVFNNIGDIQNAATYIKYFMYLAIIMFIVNIVIWLIVKQVLKVNAIQFTFDEELVENSSSIQFDSEKAKELSTTGLNNVGSFLKTKNGQVVLGIVGVVIVLFGGYKVYDTYFNKTDLNVMPKISVEFEGKNGEGYVSNLEHGNVDYDQNDSQIKDFVNSISYDYDTSRTLKNGDKIKVHAVYDKEKAKELKLNIVNDSTTVKVRGLTVTYASADKLPSKILEKAKSDIEKDVKDSCYNTTYIKTDYSFDSLYFAKGKDSNDRIAAIYKINKTTTFFGSSDTDTYYEVFYVSDVASDYLKEDHYVASTTLYEEDSFDYLTDLSNVKDILSEEFDGATITQFQ